MREYDVVIVGAGPAGCVTATTVDPRRSGLRTLILDYRRIVGVPVQDGEGLPDYGEMRRIVPGIDCEELFDFPAGIVRHRIEGMKFVAPSGRAYVGDLKGWTIDRDRLDQHFAAQAVERGAELQLSTRVVRVENGTVWTAGEPIRARWIIGADGPNSVVAASVPGLGPNRAMCRCAFVVVEGDFREDLIELWFGREWKGGYFWLFPKGTQANIGLGVRGRANPRELLDAALARLSRRKSFRLSFRGGGVVPLGGLKPRLANEHVALVGDAAGMVFPSNGGGTACAMLAGKILGETLRERRPLADYEQRVRKLLERPLARSLTMRRLLDVTFYRDGMLDLMMRLADHTGWRRFIIG
ncbi:MAG: NAD(P)/FAD-dependent oxidoreductase [Acidobacteria bacterium]|nr:NAD(P)/FAD-dependent oxidoreductase [Acidobacteriota bacterium]